MQIIMGVSMGRVKDERIKNSKIREYFCDSEKMVDIRRILQLLFAGIIERLDNRENPTQMSMATAVGVRCRGRPFRTIRDSFVDNLNFIIKN